MTSLPGVRGQWFRHYVVLKCTQSSKRWGVKQYQKICDVIYEQIEYNRLLLALHLKDIDYEYKAIHLVRDGGEQNKEDYKTLNFLGQVHAMIC